MLHFTIDDKIVQLQSGYRILVESISRQPDGSYLGQGTGQIAGMFGGYRNTQKVRIWYNPDGTFRDFEEVPPDRNRSFLQRIGIR